MMASPSAAQQHINMLEVALGYVRNFAWSVFPVCSPVVGKTDHCAQHGLCKSPGKTPLVKWGEFQDRVATEAELRAWWRRWPDANVALATGETSDVVVIDLDGELAIAEAEKRGCEPGPWASTGKVGGRHLFFRYRPDAPTIFSKVGGIDFRGHGGYVVLAPSLHRSGARYTWRETVKQGDPLPDLPAWIDQLARTGRDGEQHRTRVDFGRLLRDGLKEGERDQELFRAASKLRGADVPYDLAVWLILRAAEECRPAFDADEAKAKVDSAYGSYQPNSSVGGQAPKIWKGTELARARFDPVRWAIPGILPSGLTILAGRPKLGKSWLILGWCLDLSGGAPVLRKIEGERGPVLYLALEDSPRRMQERQAMILGERRPTDDFNVVHEWPRMGEGGIERIEEWLDANPSARLIGIDTFKRFRPKESKASRLYDLDYDAVAPLAELANRRNVAIVLVFHTNKLDPADPIDLVSGTLGLSGAADGVLVLKRERGQADASLFVTGRDVEEGDLALKWDKENQFGWWLLGQASDFRRSKERQRILDAVTAYPGMTPAEIAVATEMKPNNARFLLFAMVRDEELRSRDGRYFVLTTPTNTANAANTPNPLTNANAISVSTISGISGVSGLVCRVCGNELPPYLASIGLHYDCREDAGA